MIPRNWDAEPDDYFAPTPSRVIDNTPLEAFDLRGYRVLVKREDLCCSYPGPSFSKIRGVFAHIEGRPERYIGVLDTAHSKAGWAVAYVCKRLGKHAVNFWPCRVSENPEVLRPFQKEAHRFGATMVRLQAGRSAVLYHRARKELAATFGQHETQTYMMPNALKLSESVTENAREAMRTSVSLPSEGGTVVISISSGTVAAGVMQGFYDVGLWNKWNFILHLGYSRSFDAVRDYLERASGRPLFKENGPVLIDEGYGYADPASKTLYPAPFPANPFYDEKAWNWLADAIHVTPGLQKRPVLFWNIGA